MQNPKASNTYLGGFCWFWGSAAEGSGVGEGRLNRGWSLVWQWKGWLPSWFGSVSGALKNLHIIRDKPPNFFKFTHLKKQLNCKKIIKPRQMNKKTRQMLKENEKNKGF